MLTLSGGRQWFCTIPRSEWETGTREIDELVEHDIESGGQYGDRRQELVFIGEKLDIPALVATLDDCLLNDEEYEQWNSIMTKGEGPNAGDKKSWEEKEEELNDLFDDGFPDWEDVDDHEGHDHSAEKRVDSPIDGSPERAPGKSKHGVRKDGTVY
jgi:hypothetical protein